MKGIILAGGSGTRLSMIFPLITFPYISRILLAEGVGKYNFSYTYISYFQLLASLGISTYAIKMLEDGTYKGDLFSDL